jgi:hypothetical protein
MYILKKKLRLHFTQVLNCISVTTMTCGQLLCSGLFSHDPLSNWFSAVALSHALIENPAQKEQLLRVLLAASSGTPPVSLLHQAALLLQQVELSFFLLILEDYPYS